MSSQPKYVDQDEMTEHQNPQHSALLHVMQTSAMPATVDRSSASAAIPEGSRGKFFGLIKNAEVRRHEDVMQMTRNVGAETEQAMAISGAIAVDYFANAMDAEAAMGDVILQYRNSPLAMAGAPTYSQISRSMLVHDMAATAQAGTARIRRKIENR